MASGLFAITWMLRMPVLIYGVALVFNQVSGVSLYIVSLSMSLVCIFYTTVGGLRAVVWTDALQGSVMIISTLIVLVVGLLKVGGFHNILIKACEGGRLEMFNMNPDPTERLTFWSSTIGITFMWISDATNPLTTQRYLSLPSLKAARKVLLFLVLGLCLINLMSGLVGLIIYANYSSCDPLSTKKIERPDQILPFFILDVAGHLKGLSGLFVAGIVCAGISSLSTGMNTLAGTIYRDFIEPVIGSQSEKRASNIMKALSVIIGVICIALVPFVERFGNIIDMGAAVGGVTSGAVFGVFTMGVLIPRVNNKGAFYGGLASSVFMMWTMIGHQLATRCYDKKPVSIEGCNNVTITTAFENNTCEAMSDTFKTIFPLYKLTAFYYGFLGFTLSLLIGIIISYITGFNEPNSIRSDLLSPIIRTSKTEENTKYIEVPLKIIRVTNLE